MEDKEIHEICEKYKVKNYKINNSLIDVDGDVDLIDQNLGDLPLNFGEISGDFYCGGNKLGFVNLCLFINII